MKETESSTEMKKVPFKVKLICFVIGHKVPIYHVTGDRILCAHGKCSRCGKAVKSYYEPASWFTRWQ